VRRIVLLGAVLALTAFVGVAYAVTDTLTYTATVAKKGKASAKNPAPVQYTGELTIDTNPPGNQPDIGSPTTIYFAKQFIQNSKYFPACAQAEVDGAATIPAKCQKAVVGTGEATAYAGQPGNPRSSSVMEQLDVKAINGAPAGTMLMLVVSSKPGAPVAISNRVIPGTLLGGASLSKAHSSASWAYGIRFDIPENLQTQLGLSISLAHFKVTISPAIKQLKVKGKKKKLSYLALSACPPAGLPVKAVTVFKDSTGATTPVTSESVAKC
jgi:hypothetical protein